MLAHEDPSTNAVPLRFNKKTLSTNGPPSSSSITLPSTTANNNTKASTSNGITPSSNPVNNLTSTLTNGKRKIDVVEPPKPAGVGFVDFSDDLDEIVTGEDNYEDGDDDDDLIDEDTLLDEDDLARPINQRELKIRRSSSLALLTDPLADCFPLLRLSTRVSSESW